MDLDVIPPTGSFNLRQKDKWAEGHYGATRTKKRGGVVHSYAHNGLDMLVNPGQVIIMPFLGKITRSLLVYAKNDEYHGIEIMADQFKAKIFYMKVFDDSINEFISPGTIIGIAEDICKKYPGITPHIHFQIYDLEMGRYINPYIPLMVTLVTLG